MPPFLFVSVPILEFLGLIFFFFVLFVLLLLLVSLCSTTFDKIRQHPSDYIHKSNKRQYPPFGTTTIRNVIFWNYCFFIRLQNCAHHMSGQCYKIHMTDRPGRKRPLASRLHTRRADSRIRRHTERNLSHNYPLAVRTAHTTRTLTSLVIPHVISTLASPLAARFGHTIPASTPAVRGTWFHPTVRNVAPTPRLSKRLI